MAKYKQRIADRFLERKLLGKGAVLIEGPKWCGKTATADFAQMSFRTQFPESPVAADVLQFAELAVVFIVGAFEGLLRIEDV